MTHASDESSLAIADFGWEFVGDASPAGADFAEGQMYVERYEPLERRQPWSIVLWHGAGQTGANFTATPDGRRGWLQDFLRAGYRVYVVDQPERGRSGHAPDVLGAGKLIRYSRARIESRFTAPAVTALWPQAHTHGQWPGTGQSGDAVFESYFASQVEMLADRARMERLNRDAGAALLDRIGPAVVLTHSQSGPFGWLIADARPDLVKAVLAIEPNGPPYRDLSFVDGDRWRDYEPTVERPWGITRAPLTFESTSSNDPPAPSWHGELAGDHLVGGYLQSAPARRLVHLAGLPILVVTAESSFHAPYDHVTSAFLAQAGVAHDFVRLGERGIRGNGHMMMLERNNHEIADLLIEWLAQRLEDAE